MFEYAKGEIYKKINKLESEIALRKEVELSCKRNREHIGDYFNIKNEISSFIRTAVFESVVGVVLICIGCQYRYIAPLICGFFCFPVAGLNISKTIEKKKLLKNDYSDILSRSDSELSEKLSELCQKEFDASEERRIFERKIKHYGIELDKFRRYYAIVEEVMVEMVKDPYYKADTEAEYQMLVSTQEKKLNMMNDFLIENNDYSKVHFDNNIGDDIQYTDNSKKLFKKL